MGLTQGRRKGVQQIGLAFATLGDQIDQHLGVGFRVEDIALGREFGLDFLVVFNDAVVHQGQRGIVAQMGMGVALRRHAVRGPAGVPHSAGGRGNRLLGQVFLQGRQFALGSHHAQSALAHKGHAGRIITPVFQTAQALHHHGHGGPVARISDNAAHISYSRKTRSL